jgi:hypothetical protein
MIEEAARLFGMKLKVQRVPLPAIMRKVFPLLKIPAEVDAFLQNNTRYSTAHMKSDYPQLKCPLVSEYFPAIVSGSKELFR